MSTFKRPKFLFEDEEEQKQRLCTFRTDITECECCQMEFEMSDRWAHFAGHPAICQICYN
jgi:hypothetical protein